jgi:transposase
MKIFREYNQGQGLLLPPSLDEFVPDDHEARIVNEVVDTVDLSPLLAKYEGGGAPAYHPVMMLKVIIYAYSRDIYSSRSIAQELKTDTAFMFLSGLQSPDFRTICLFRSEHADVLPELFVKVVRLCASLVPYELNLTQRCQNIFYPTRGSKLKNLAPTFWFWLVQIRYGRIGAHCLRWH